MVESVICIWKQILHKSITNICFSLSFFSLLLSGLPLSGLPMSLRAMSSVAKKFYLFKICDRFVSQTIASLMQSTIYFTSSSET